MSREAGDRAVKARSRFITAKSALASTLVFVLVACGAPTEGVTEQQDQERITDDSASQIMPESEDEEFPLNQEIEDESDSPLPLEILEQVSRVEEFSSGIRVEWAIIFRNPNESLASRFARFRATARSESGQILGTDESVIGDIGPGMTTGWTTWLDATEIPDKVEIEFVQSDWMKGRKTPGDFPEFPASNLAITDGGYQFLITGEVVNPYPDFLESARVMAALRDESGQLIGAGQTYPSALRSNEKTPFEIDAWAVGKPSAAEIYAQPW